MQIPKTRLRAYPKGAWQWTRPPSCLYIISAVPLMYAPPTHVANHTKQTKTVSQFWRAFDYTFLVNRSVIQYDRLLACPVTIESTERSGKCWVSSLGVWDGETVVLWQDRSQTGLGLGLDLNILVLFPSLWVSVEKMGAVADVTSLGSVAVTWKTRSSLSIKCGNMYK